MPSCDACTIIIINWKFVKLFQWSIIAFKGKRLHSAWNGRQSKDPGTIIYRVSKSEVCLLLQITVKLIAWMCVHISRWPPLSVDQSDLISFILSCNQIYFFFITPFVIKIPWSNKWPPWGDKMTGLAYGKFGVQHFNCNCHKCGKLLNVLSNKKEIVNFY